jgi:4-hydroxy-3-methylbut-2-enyl diphosphate reductase
MFQVIVATELGMCFGVKDAIEVARGIAEPANVSIWGELVHNPQVTRQLQTAGFRLVEETRRQLPDTPRVLITAHGVSDRERQRLQVAGHDVIDTTCPLVRRAHRQALALHEQGYTVLVIGRPGHVEVEGLIGDLERCHVVPDPSAVRNYGANRLGVVCQTTTASAEAASVMARIRELNAGAEVRFVDTICKPTRDRQRAVAELLGKVQALVVVGGINSNNTRRLGLAAELAGVPWAHIQGPEQLNAAWLRNYDVVGLTAGTSTPDEVIESVHQRLRELSVPAQLSLSCSA